MDTTHRQDEEDLQVLNTVINGDMIAFERLYQLYERRVYHYVYTLVHDPAVAEEVLVDTMTAVWRGAGSFAHTSRVSTWIFGIARHKALDALRRSTRNQQHVSLDQAPDLPYRGDCAEDQVHCTQVTVLIKHALALLSKEHQEVLRLTYYEELPYQEVAILLSIPTNTVKSRVFYAKQQLKKHLERLGQREPYKW
jgi:RNA polymerase sigma-70 factor (ECF subfamily)